MLSWNPRKLIGLTLCIAAWAAAARAQVPEASRLGRVQGEVLSVGKNEILLSTSYGPFTIRIETGTEFRRVPAQGPFLKNAVTSTVDEISIADKLLVVGEVYPIYKLVRGRSLFVIPQVEISRRNVREAEIWDERGVSGKVTAVNLEKNLVTIKIRNLANYSTLDIQLQPNTIVKRYTPLSAKYADAITGRIVDIRTGDVLRALGSRPGVNTFNAEIVVTGAFRTTVGRVVSVSDTTGELILEDIRTRQYVTVVCGPDADLRRLSVSQQLVVPAAQLGRPRSVDSIFYRSPQVGVRDIRIGDTVAVSSARLASPTRISAINLLVGVEYLFPPRPAGSIGSAQVTTGDWSGLPGFDYADFP
jgi:ribosomal protein L24